MLETIYWFNNQKDINQDFPVKYTISNRARGFIFLSYRVLRGKKKSYIYIMRMRTVWNWKKNCCRSVITVHNSVQWLYVYQVPEASCSISFSTNFWISGQTILFSMSIFDCKQTHFKMFVFEPEVQPNKKEIFQRQSQELEGIFLKTIQDDIMIHNKNYNINQIS